MNDRRSFIGLCAATASSVTATASSAADAAAKASDRADSATTGGASSCKSVYDGILGRGYARGPHGLVHFHDSAGLAKPAAGELPLLLLHQSPASGRQFESAFRPLVRRNVRYVAIDTPGFGFSDPTPSFPKLEQWASSFVAVMDHLGIEQADVLGHHTGALNATEVALQFPARIERLILNGPLPLEDAERAAWLEFCRTEEIPYHEKPDGSHMTKLFGIRYGFATDTVPPGTVTRYIAETLGGLGPFWYGHHAAFRYDHGASLPKIQHRTLILTNTGDQIYEHAKLTHRMRPDFAFTALEGGGIDVVDQLPDAWTEAVAAFLLAK